MTMRLQLSTATMALCLGLGVPAVAMAEAEPAGAKVPFCAADENERAFPCRSANQSVVNTTQELMSRGGGVAPEWMVQQERARQQSAGAPTPAAKPQARPAAPAPQAEGETAAPDRRAAEQAQTGAAQPAAGQPRPGAQQGAEQARKTQQESQAREAERAARRAERRAERAEAAAAAQEGSAREPADVREEVVRESGVRKSSEDFDTSVAGTGQNAAPRPPAKADDDGLDKLGKAALIGLGALAVGKILNNGDEVVANSGDRVVVRRDGDLAVLKNDDVLLRRPGDKVRTERFSDGSTRSTVTRDNGVRVVTIRASDGTVLRRSRLMPDGREYVLFDDTQRVAPVDLGQLPAARVDPQRPAAAGGGNDAALRRALQAELNADVGRRFSLDQVRSIAPVRYLAPEIEVDAITFATGSAAIAPDQARELADLGTALSRLLGRHPDTVLLIEGHTDAVGDASYNLALSDRRAESVALALSEYFDVPPENMVIQGYGEQLLKVPTQAAEPENRRAVVRNITALLN